MEKQGIITGIGNEITPEIDAVINEYIVGKNTILKGLELNGNILSAGTCILCGYRGTLENIQTVYGNYVYGKFVIGVNETDSFSIITLSSSTEPTDGIINPTSITSAGTYYLRLYANGVSQVDSERYPKQSYISDKANELMAGGTIDSTATTPTEKNFLGEVVVDLHKTQPKRVANTEYVHKQIENEIDYELENITVNINNSAGRIQGTIELKKKAKYVIGKALNFWAYKSVSKNTLLGKITNAKFYPAENKYGCMKFIGDASAEGGTIPLNKSVVILITTDGRIVMNEALSDTSYDVYNDITFYLGYEI